MLSFGTCPAPDRDRPAAPPTAAVAPGVVCRGPGRSSAALRRAEGMVTSRTRTTWSAAVSLAIAGAALAPGAALAQDASPAPDFGPAALEKYTPLCGGDEQLKVAFFQNTLTNTFTNAE